MGRAAIGMGFGSDDSVWIVAIWRWLRLGFLQQVLEMGEIMKLTGIHFLLTYQCVFECDHCFVWSSPRQSGVFTLDQIRRVLAQAGELGTVDSIFFEGGEPFLYYRLMVKGLSMAKAAGFETGVVSNGYWATETEDALEWLKPIAMVLDHLTVSTDLFHFSEKISRQSQHILAAAEALGMSVGNLTVAQPEEAGLTATGQLPDGECEIMYRGRAAAKLTAQAEKKAWNLFTECPYEDLREPGRLHLDPLGNLHICQGISIGNLFEKPLADICRDYDPDTHPIVGPILAGGPAKLAETYGVKHEDAYADACHLCYETRVALRDRFPGCLTPDQMYGVES